MTQTTFGTSTSTFYAYDHNDQRVKYNSGSTTNYFANQFYNVTQTTGISNSTTTKQIYANNQLIATVTGTSSPTIHYVHNDQIGSSNVISNSSGNIEELTDYYPFGEMRFDNTTSFNEQNKFTGKQFDADTGYNYFGARYYDGHIARFISQDPVFLAIGDDNQFKKEASGLDLKTYLTDPQQLNSYSYARNNPIKNTDPNGKLGGIDDLAFFAFLLFNPRQLSADPVYEPELYAVQNSPITKVMGSFSEGGLKIQGSVMEGVEARLGQSALQSEGSMVCRGGSCSAENFIRGSNEFKNGLKPSVDTPLTGISVNIGNSIEEILQGENFSKFNKFGQSTPSIIQKNGGTIIVDSKPSLNNPGHANINGLNATQLENIFKPTVSKNPYSRK